MVFFYILVVVDFVDVADIVIVLSIFFILEPSDYTYASEFGFYYSIKTVPRLFLDAALVCQLEGGSLFMSDTEAKNNFIVNAIGNNGEYRRYCRIL